MTDTIPTYPAAFTHSDDGKPFRAEDLSIEAIPSPTGDELACDWGNAEACLADNAQRASFAGLALKAYAQRTNPSGGMDAETMLGDLLNDLRHLCDAFDLDFEDLAARDTAYQAELRGEF